jgi:hypothetical protein
MKKLDDEKREVNHQLNFLSEDFKMKLSSIENFSKSLKAITCKADKFVEEEFNLEEYSKNYSSFA